jgi:hypothetical protein
MKTNIHVWPYLAQFFSEWEMSQTKVAEETISNILFSLTFFPPENHALYEITWKSIVESDRLHMTVWSMRIAGWLPKLQTHIQNM